MNLKETDLKMPLCVTLAAISVMSAVSCVNEEYDLNKDIDTTISINGDISAPLGSTEAIMIGDFLAIDEENSVLVADPQTGDYSLHVEAEEPISQKINIDRVNLNPDELIMDGGFSVKVDVKSLVDGAYEGILNDDTDVSNVRIEGADLLSEPETTEININEDVSGMTTTVKALGTVYLDTPIELNISMASGKVTVKSGMTLNFPEYVRLELSGVYDYDFCSIQDGHTLKFDRDVEVGTEGLVLNMNMTEIYLDRLHEAEPGQGLVNDRIVVNQDITVSGLVIDAYARDFGKTYGDMPDELGLDITMNVTGMDIKGGTAVIEPDITVDDQTIPVGEMPEFLTGEDIVLDIYNPYIVLDVTNTSPVQILFTAKLDGVNAEGASLLDMGPIIVGSHDSDDPAAILLEQGTSRMYLSARSMDVSGEPGAKNVVIDRLADIVKTIPYEIRLTEVTADVPLAGNATDGYKESDYIEFTFPDDGTSGLEYDFSVDYSVDVPLAFGENLKLTYPYDITGLNDTLNPDSSEEGTDDNGMTIRLEQAQIKMTFVNAIPLNMEVTASPIDVDGKVISDPSLSVELKAADGSQAKVAAGAIGSESLCPTVINVTADAESLKKLDGFRLNITGTSDVSYVNVPLNSGQYVRITDMSVRINGGVDMQL